MKNYLTFCLLLVLLSCGTRPAHEAKETKYDVSLVTLTAEQRQNAGIELGSAERRSMQARVLLKGRVEVPPRHFISVSMPLGGYIKSTTLAEGIKVKRGQVLAIMEDQSYIDLQQKYLMAKARKKVSEEEYERQKELNKSKTSSDKIFQQAEADYRAARVELAALAEKIGLIGLEPSALSEDNLSRSISIYAPVDGYVTKVNVNTGRYVGPQEVLFSMADLRHAELGLTVLERDVEKLQPGLRVMAYTNNSPKKHECELYLVGKSLSDGLNTKAWCRFLNYDPALIPGMYMNAEVTFLGENTLALPAEAILEFEGASFVFIEQQPGIYKMLPVKTGIMDGTFTEVNNEDGLDKAKVVLKGGYTLLMMLKNEAE